MTDSAGNPLVSVGIATYNGAETIARALESLEAQTYTNLEVIISDDGSSDETARICQEFVARNAHWRFSSNSGERGMLSNYRALVSQASGEYFCLVDQDDRREPAFICEAVRALRCNPQLVGWVCGVEVVWAPGNSPDKLRPMHLNLAPSKLGDGNPVTRLSCLSRRYFDAWMYGVYRRKALMHAYETVHDTPVFPAVVLTDLVLSGPLGVSRSPLIEYRAKGSVKRSAVDSDVGRVSRQARQRGRVPYLFQQGTQQLALCFDAPALSGAQRVAAAGVIAWDVAASATARIMYRVATRVRTPRALRVADSLADLLHPHDLISFHRDPYEDGYLRRDWRAH